MKSTIKKSVLLGVFATTLFTGGAFAGEKGFFTDVVGRWSEPAVKEVTSLGIMKGFDDGTFHPEQYVTREEIAQIVSNTLKNVKSQSSKGNSTENAVAIALPSTVRIDVSGSRYGAGFFVTEDLVLTNWHIAQFGNVTVHSLNSKTFKGEVVKKDIDRDLALIKIDPQENKFIPLQFASDVKLGEDVIAIGTPQGFSFDVTKGIISKTETYTNGKKFIGTDAAINAGNSGGALLNMAGEVVGVVSNKNSADGFEGLGFAIPYYDAKKFVEGK